MTKFSDDIKAQIMAGLEAGDLQAIHDVLDALEDVDNPNLVRVEFKRSTMAFFKEVKQDIGPSGAFDLSDVVALCIDGMIKSYHAEKARKKASYSEAIKEAAGRQQTALDGHNAAKGAGAKGLSFTTNPTKGIPEDLRREKL